MNKFKEIKDIGSIKGKELLELIELLKNDTFALNDFINDFEPQLAKIVNKVIKTYTNLHGFDFDDAMQTARLALYNAIEKFDNDKYEASPCKFFTYIFPCVKNALLCEIRKNRETRIDESGKIVDIIFDDLGQCFDLEAEVTTEEAVMVGMQLQKAVDLLNNIINNSSVKGDQISAVDMLEQLFEMETSEKNRSMVQTVKERFLKKYASKLNEFHD